MFQTIFDVFSGPLQVPEVLFCLYCYGTIKRKSRNLNNKEIAALFHKRFLMGQTIFYLMRMFRISLGLQSQYRMNANGLLPFYKMTECAKRTSILSNFGQLIYIETSVLTRMIKSSSLYRAQK